MSDCPTCAKMAEALIQSNPTGYEALARRKPGARLKLCPECVKTSKIHGADARLAAGWTLNPQYAFVTDDPIDPTEAARVACEERRRAIFLGLAAILAGVALWLTYKKKK